MYRLKVQLKIYYLTVNEDENEDDIMRETCLFNKEFKTKRNLIINAVALAKRYSINTTMFTLGHGYLFNKNGCEHRYGNSKEIYYCMYITLNGAELLPNEAIQINNKILKSVLNCQSSKQNSQCELNA